jgi:hypothetical protein
MEVWFILFPLYVSMENNFPFQSFCTLHITQLSSKYFSSKCINSFHVMAPILAPLLGVLFLQGHISLKNWTYCPVLRVRATPFNSTCLLIRLKEANIDLYRITDSGMSPYLPPYGRACFFNAHQRCRIEPGSCIMASSVPRLKIFIFNEY